MGAVAVRPQVGLIQGIGAKGIGGTSRQATIGTPHRESELGYSSLAPESLNASVEPKRRVDMQNACVMVAP
jgi:hypothetical protein